MELQHYIGYSSIRNLSFKIKKVGENFCSSQVWVFSRVMISTVSTSFLVFMGSFLCELLGLSLFHPDLALIPERDSLV